MVFGKKKEPLSSSILYFGTPEAIYCWFALFSIILTTLVLQMILKSMSVECNKTDMDNYAGDVDEEESGKFTFVQFCSVRIDNINVLLGNMKTLIWVISQGHLECTRKRTRNCPNYIDLWELFVSCGIDWSKVNVFRCFPAKS